jgi:hypothetical protein
VLAPAAGVVRLVGTLHGSSSSPSLQRGAGSNHTSGPSSRTGARMRRFEHLFSSGHGDGHLAKSFTYMTADAPILVRLQKLDVGSTPALRWSIGAILDWISFSGPRSPVMCAGGGHARDEQSPSFYSPSRF